MEDNVIWRPIVGYEGHYIVSNYGEVCSIKFGKIKKISLCKRAHGYLGFHASIDGKTKDLVVARAVAQAFPEICGEWFEGCTIDHIDTCKTNNAATNLRVVTLKENINNPLTIAKKRLYRTDEERDEIKKQQKRKDYQRHKNYYNNYSKTYYQNNKEYYKEYSKKYYEKHPLTEEQKEKNRQRALKYYYDHKEEIAAKNKKPKKDLIDLLKKVG